MKCSILILTYVFRIDIRLFFNGVTSILVYRFEPPFSVQLITLETRRSISTVSDFCFLLPNQLIVTVISFQKLIS